MSAQTHLDIEVFKSPVEAPSFKEPEHKGIRIEKANIVRNGTESGLSTVDLILVDESGQKYMMMITGRLIHSLDIMIGEGGR